MSTLLLLTPFLLFVGLCLRPPARPAPLAASTGSTGSTGSTPSTSSPHPLPDPLHLLPEPLADALHHLTAELRYRASLYPALHPHAAARRARRDGRFAIRLRRVYRTLTLVQRVHPAAALVEPAEFLPAGAAADLQRTEKYLAELTRAWRVYDLHPSGVEFERALTALARITALRRSALDLARTCPRPENFPGWDVDHHLNPLAEDIPFIFPDDADVPPDAAELIEALLRPPSALHAPDSSPPPSALSRSRQVSRRSPRALAAIPAKLFRFVRRYGDWFVYCRPYFKNPVSCKMCSVTGRTVLHFSPPENPHPAMSDAEKGWWRAEEQRQIRVTYDPARDSYKHGIPPTSLPPWGWDDPPYGH